MARNNLVKKINDFTPPLVLAAHSESPQSISSIDCSDVLAVIFFRILAVSPKKLGESPVYSSPFLQSLQGDLSRKSSRKLTEQRST